MSLFSNVGILNLSFSGYQPPKCVVRPPAFLDQLAARWVADWNKEHPYQPPVAPLEGDNPERENPEQEQEHGSIETATEAAPIPGSESDSNDDWKERLQREHKAEQSAMTKRLSEVRMSNRINVVEYYGIRKYGNGRDKNGDAHLGSRAHSRSKNCGRKPCRDCNYRVRITQLPIHFVFDYDRNIHSYLKEIEDETPIID